MVPLALPLVRSASPFSCHRFFFDSFRLCGPFCHSLTCFYFFLLRIVFAAVVALLNSQRHAEGKKPLGFLNQILYSAPTAAFTDITSGNNKCTESCCATYGFTATAGWDAVTGLGTPSWSGLFNYVQTLP